MAAIQALLLLILLLLALKGHDCFKGVVSNLADRSHDCDDPLACYMYSLVLNLPDFEADGITFYGMVLKHIVIERLPSSYIEPNILDIGVTNLGATITGKYKKGILAGPMAAKLSRTTFNTQLAFNHTTYPDTIYTVPNGLAYVPDTCHFDSIHVAITLTTNLPHPGADAALKTVIKNLVCITLGDILATNVTNDMQTKLDPQLVNIMESSPSSVPDDVLSFAQGSDSVHWTSTLFGPIHNMIESFSGTRVFDCFIKTHDDTISMPYIDSIVNNLVDYATQGTGLLVIDLESLTPIEEKEEKGEAEEGLCASLRASAAPFLTCSPSGLAALDLSSLSVNVGLNVSLTPLQMVIGGLDTFTQLAVAETSGDDPALLSSQINMDLLEFNFTARVDYGNGEMHYNDTITLQFTSINVSVGMDLVLALYKDTLEGYTLAQSLSPYCLARVVEYMNVTNMDIVSHITTFQLHETAIDEPLEEDAMLLIDNTLRLFIDGMPSFVTQLITGLSQGVIRQSINTLFTTGIDRLISKDNESGVCGAIPGREHHWGWLVWPSSTLLADIDIFINSFIGTSGINEMANCLTSDTGAVQWKSFYLPFFGNISIQLSGLNSFYSMHILEPFSDINHQIQPYSLHSGVGIGYCDPGTHLNINGGACSPFEVIMSFAGNSEAGRRLREIILPSPSLSSLSSVSSTSRVVDEKRLISSLTDSSDYSVALSMMNMSLSLQSLLEVNLDTLVDMTIDDLETRGCVEGSIDMATLQSLDLTVAEIEAILISPGSNSTVDLTAQITALLPSLDVLLLSLVNEQLAQTLSDDTQMCSNGGTMPSSHDNADSDQGELAWEWQLGLISMGSILLLAVYALSHRYLDRREKPGSDSDSTHDDNKGEHTLLALDETQAPHRPGEGSGDDTTNLYCDGLSFSSTFNVWNRIFYPVATMATIYLFIYSNMSPDPVTVYADITVGEVTHAPLEVFKFTLGGTVKDMWNAEVYILATLIAFFSGGWPYVKLVVMLAAWLLPSSIFPKTQRGQFLKFVDAYGKWSLVDFFVMCLFLCAFHFDLQLSEDPTVEIVMRVMPSWGFYSFLLATLLSLGLGHMTVLFHRLDVGEIDTTGLNGISTKETMKDHIYLLEAIPSVLLDVCKEAAAHGVMGRKEAVGFMSRSDTLYRAGGTSDAGSDGNSDGKGSSEGKEGSRGADPLLSIDAHDAYSDHDHDSADILAIEVAVTDRGRLCMIALCFLSIIFTLCSVLLMSFYFKFQGLIGYLLKDTASATYSVMTVGTSMVVDSGIPNDIAMRWMQANFILFTAVMPLFAAGLWLTVWNLNAISISVHKSIILLGEVIYAWSALDVFAVSIVASMLEIKQFAMFMVGDKCDEINAILAQYFDNQLHHDDKCFDVETTLSGYGAFFLFFAPVFVVLVVLPNLTLGEKALEERIDRARVEVEMGVVSREGSRGGKADLKHATRVSALSDAHAIPSGGTEGGADIESDLNRPLLSSTSTSTVSYLALLRHKERDARNASTAPTGTSSTASATAGRTASVNSTTITTPLRAGESKSEERGVETVTNLKKGTKEKCCSTLVGTFVYCKEAVQGWLIEKSYQWGMITVIRPITTTIITTTHTTHQS